MSDPPAGGSGTGHIVQQQNAIIDLAAQNTAAQLAQQILANTNVTLKQEVVKTPEFFSEKGKDTVNAQECSTTGTTPPLLPISDSVCVVKQKIGFLQPSDIWSSGRLKRHGHELDCCTKENSPLHPMTSSSLMDWQTWPTDQERILINFSQGQKNCSTFCTRITLPTVSNLNVQLNFRLETTRRMP
jgi:hypothetical protein